MLLNKTWQPIPGTRHAEIYPFLRKPDVLSANAFLVRTPEVILLVDPGACRDQAAAIHALIDELIREKPRPVLVHLTHCHIDHSLQAVEYGPLRELSDIQLVMHEAGAGALRAGDRRLTVADLFGRQYPPVMLPIRAFASLPRGESGRPAAEQVLPCHRTPLGSGEFADLFHTPGHSPDSVCLRIGRLLIIGDLLTTVSPMVAGITGWSRDDFLHSLETVGRLIDASPIDLCLPGHGHELTGTAVKELLHGLRTQAECLDAVEEMNEGRLLDTVAHALELLEEAQTIFTMVAGRLYYVCYHLEELGECEAADQYRNLLSADGIDACISHLDQLTESWRRGERLNLEFAYKVLSIVQKMRQSFDPEQLNGVIHRSLLKRSASLLTDFIEMAQGKSRQRSCCPTDLPALLEELRRGWKSSLRADQAILETSHDHPLFVARLAARIGYLPIFDDVEIRCSAPDGFHTVPMDRERFSEALTSFLEVIAGAHAGRIELLTMSDPHEVRLAITADGRHADLFHDARHWQPFQRKFARSGGRLCREMTDDGADYQIRFGREG